MQDYITYQKYVAQSIGSSGRWQTYQGTEDH